ncbi:ABC transporter ATP-binding protein [Saccharopolyspora rhizosphaerae]|uniref:ABC transporter ATP-binding protein n=1 Tax=Saccharopolyspora rhizosphaerae TaxID=2492662 RepID=A0A426JQQ0_9PSEU|nr:ABC transporter ATP-binding protein [Saccharopolyspora rhizosphaerae]RRO15471.1 ABC transporter ATP-binding protein [Saccharopolyspora rhizosphaerae]
MTTVIEVDGLRCRYGDFEAVQGVGFAVRRGELFALLGTNGAGKTTVLETVEGHREPAGGRVRVFGVDPSRDRRIRRRTGIMLQDSGFAGDLTVRETAELARRMRTEPSDVDGALAALGLDPRRDVRVRQLSGGEKRRLDLALALLGEPELLFLDEPTVGMDPESRRTTWEIVRGLLARGTTVLLTTHYLEEAERLAHRLAIMHQGRIAVEGRLVDVLADHPARITFTAPEVPLPPLAGTATRRGPRVEIRTPHLQQDLLAVLAWADGHVDLSGLRAHPASLEEVFQSVREEVPA